MDALSDVKAFHLSENVSRILPSRNDYSFIDSERGKSYLQKNLLLSNLKDAYQTFKESNSLV